MSKTLFHGVIPPVVTLFDDNGQFSPTQQARHIERLVASDVEGLFFLGSAGEFAHMSDTMRMEIAEFCIRHVAGRKPVLIGIGHSGTQQAIALGEHAQRCGADGVVAINPYYNPLSEQHLLTHYRRISHALSVPILLYNFPVLTGQSLSVKLITELALSCPNIVGLKDTVDTLSHIRETLAAVKPLRPDFAIFAGYDEYLFGTLILGGDGCIPASANFAPQLTCGIYQAWLQGNYERVVSLQQQLSFLSPLYNIDIPFYNAVKYAIKLTDENITCHSLPPTEPLTELMKQQIKDILTASHII